MIMNRKRQKEFPCKRGLHTSILLNGWYLSHQRSSDSRRDDGLFYCHIKAIKARIVITRVSSIFSVLRVFLSTLGHKLRYHKALKKEAIDNSDNNSTDFFVQPEIGGHFGGPLEGALGTSVTTNYKILFLYMPCIFFFHSLANFSSNCCCDTIQNCLNCTTWDVKDKIVYKMSLAKTSYSAVLIPAQDRTLL